MNQNHFKIRNYALELAYEFCVGGGSFLHVVKKYFLLYTSAKNLIYINISRD